MSKDKFLGGLVGLATGDALGTTVEFMPRGSFEPVTDIVGGGPFELKSGQWTDDTSMALCLAQSLVEKHMMLPHDQLNKYLDWYQKGYMSSTGKCFDIGMTTVRALKDYRSKGIIKRSDNPEEAGNGSLMRLVPVSLFYSNSIKIASDVSGQSSLTTHGAKEAIDSCRFFGYLIATIIQNPEMSKEDLLNLYKSSDILWTKDPLSDRVHNIAAGIYFTKEDKQIFSSGYVIHSLEAALWSFYKTNSFEEGALKAVNLGDDADSVGAIYGQIAGVFYGYEGIPERWRNQIHDLSLIESLATQLHENRWQE